jgi:mono/diheme cytochrome c family protein
MADSFREENMRILTVVAITSSILAGCEQATVTEPVATSETSQKQQTVSRHLDGANGRALFVDKGCVICHAVNGVGGKAAPALDAEIGGSAVDPLEFAARMWRGAPAMIELQSVELGYSISLTADEIGDLAAFAADREQQKTFTVDDLPETIKNGLLDEQFWEIEDWDGFLKTGREGDDFDDPDQPDEEAPQ